jgi:hypothetical protein
MWYKSTTLPRHIQIKWQQVINKMRLPPPPQQLLDVKYVQQQTLDKFGLSRMLSPFHAEKELST